MRRRRSSRSRISPSRRGSASGSTIDPVKNGRITGSSRASRRGSRRWTIRIGWTTFSRLRETLDSCCGKLLHLSTAWAVRRSESSSRRSVESCATSKLSTSIQTAVNRFGQSSRAYAQLRGTLLRLSLRWMGKRPPRRPENASGRSLQSDARRMIDARCAVNLRERDLTR